MIATVQAIMIDQPTLSMLLTIGIFLIALLFIQDAFQRHNLRSSRNLIDFAKKCEARLRFTPGKAMIKGRFPPEAVGADGRINDMRSIGGSWPPRRKSRPRDR